MEITTTILFWAFGLAMILGIVATKTNFCTMGAISDWVNIGDTGRMRAWVFAIGLASFDNILAGLVIAGVVVTAWWVTTGELGQELLEEAEMMDDRPFALGAQSFTFVQPSAHFFRWIETGFSQIMLTFALVAGFGVVAGSFLYSIVTKTFRIEWFASFKDFVFHIIGGVLMGVGGVLAMGCTIGQAVTGASTLALGSFVTFMAIIIGCTLTMKIQYYRMVYEDEASFIKALVASLADMKLLPNGLRKLDKI